MRLFKRDEAIGKAVVDILRKERERQKLSMNELAAKSSLSLSMVSYVERGMRNPTLQTLLRMTQVLKIDLADVIRKAERGVPPTTS